MYARSKPSSFSRHSSATMLHLAQLSHVSVHRHRELEIVMHQEVDNAQSGASATVPTVKRTYQCDSSARTQIAHTPMHDRMQHVLKTNFELLRDRMNEMADEIRMLTVQLGDANKRADDAYVLGAKFVHALWTESIGIIFGLEMKQAGLTDRQIHIIRACMGKQLKPSIKTSTFMRWVKKPLHVDDIRLACKLIMSCTVILSTFNVFDYCSLVLSHGSWMRGSAC